ncbi:MAG TPA: peptidase M22 [Opitutaceae bacterium]|nr:peptidase M22 [Opitutaceae bacterium]
MPSLRQVLGAHAPLLLIDAASARIQVGWWEGGWEPRWTSSEAEAGVGIFQCLEELGADPARARGLAFCSGPGSILGIRTAAMALRAWRSGSPAPAFGYSSLALAAHGAPPAASLIADARRGAWHLLRPGEPLRRVPAAELSGDLAMPAGFRHWSPLPAGTASVSYELPALWAKAADADLLLPTEEPDAFLHAEPAYALWSAQPHHG